MLWPLSLSQTQSNALTEDFVIIFCGRNAETSESRDVRRTHAAGEFLFLVRKHLSDGKINLFFWRRLTLEPWFLWWCDCLAESCERVDLEEEKTCVSWTYACEHMNKTPYQD